MFWFAFVLWILILIRVFFLWTSLSLLSFATHCCTLSLVVMPCYSTLLLAIVPCCFTLLFIVAPCYSPSCLATWIFFKYFLPIPPLLFAFVFCCFGFFMNWYSFPTFLCMWRSLEQHPTEVNKNSQFFWVFFLSFVLLLLFLVILFWVECILF